jgi:protein-disulfide isomerase/cyclophilin family peptidyl-prolyl cis-trans isomerase
MRKLKIRRPFLSVALALILLVLAACSGNGATPAPTPVPTEVSESEPVGDPAEDPGVTEPEMPTVAPTGDPSEPVVVTPPEELAVCEAAALPELPVRPVDETDWVKGASEADATMTIYEYSDFQCPGCAGMYPVLQAFLDDHPDVRLVYRHFPLDFHPLAMVTAEATEAAGAQGKFWEMHDLLFDRAAIWSAMTEEEVRTAMSEYAAELDLDVEAFDAALDEGTYVEKIEAQYDESISLGLPGTPTFIFDNVLFPSDIGLSYQGLVSFKSILDSQDEIFFPEPPEVTVDAEDAYEALLTTSQGEVRIQLLPTSAPVNVNNFVFLAEEQWYDGSEFFFVRDGFVAVTGDPTNSTVGYPGYYCTGEQQGDFDRAGLVGMLSNGQFFITLGPEAAQLSGQFALVGQVTEGFDVLDALSRVMVGDPEAPPADVLESVEIVQN